jgi:hypothetical protein
MSNVIPFNESNKLPAHIAARAKGRVNTDLTSHVGNGGFPVLSIKGKNFTLVKDKERKLIERPDADGEMAPARALEVVILKANPNLSKVWYIKGFEDGSAEKPDCFSNDGKAPDSSVEKPQSKSCATCKNNVWGSGKEGKGKACTDSRRLAIAAPDQLNEPMLLRVPPASLKPLAEYGKKLDNRGTSYDAVVTKLKFDVEEATPKLVFLPVAFLSPEQLAEVDEVANSELVGQITGTAATPHAAAESDEEDEAFEQLEKSKKKPAAPADEEDEPAPAPKKKAKPAPADDEDEPAPKKKPAAKVVDDDDLDSILAELDD